MASQSALSLLPAIGYALLAALACYLVYRVVITRRRRGDGAASAALPNPVGVGSATRSRARWNGWSLPWPRVPWSSKSGTSNTDTLPKKNLSVELLPTTGLPPHPASTPTPTGPLVDLTPPTPPLIPSASASPRTPSLAHKGIRAPSPHALLATTSPSKHKRSRSLGGVPVRRLSGGSSGLRNKVDFDLEGGDLEMREFRAGHTRGTSREGLLIDFSSSSGSSSESYSGTGTPSTRASSEETRISPAASDIGVLKLPVPSPSSLFSSTGTASTILATRPVPPINLSDSPFPSSFPSSTSFPPSFPAPSTSFPSSQPPPPLLNPHDNNEGDDAWKWFGPSTPSHVKIYTPQPAARPVSVQAWNVGALQVPVSLPVPGLLQKERKEKEEKLVDVDDPSAYAQHEYYEQKEGRPGPLGPGTGQGCDPLDSSKTLVEFELSSHHDHGREKKKEYHHGDDHELLVDVRPISPSAQDEATLVDLHDSASAAVGTGLVPSPSPNSSIDPRALSPREDPFSNAYTYDPAAPVALVDVSEHEHDHYEYEQGNDHPHENPTTLALPLPLPLSLSPDSQPQPQPQATHATPAPAPAFVHHPLEDLVPIPLPLSTNALPIPIPGQVDSKPGFAQHAHEVPVAPRDGGLLFSSSPSASVEVLVPTAELSLSPLPLVSQSAERDNDMPVFDFDFVPADDRVRAGAGAGVGAEDGVEVEREVQGWKWDDDNDEEEVPGEEEDVDPWAGHVVLVGEVEEAIERRSAEVEDVVEEVMPKDEEEDVDGVPPKSAEGEAETPTPTSASASASARAASEEEAEPETPPSPPLPLILLDADLLDASASASPAQVEETEVYPDPELLPLPLPLPSQPLSHVDTTRPQIVVDVCLSESATKPHPTPTAASQTPTPPASPPPVSPLSLSLRVVPSGSGGGSGGASPVSPRPSRGNLRVDARTARSRPVSPRVGVAGLPEGQGTDEEGQRRDEEKGKPLWAVSTAERVELQHEHEREEVKEVREAVEVGPQETMKAESEKADSEKEEEEHEDEQAALPLPEKAEALADDEDEPPSPLPGSFPSSAPPVLSTSPSISTTTSVISSSTTAATPSFIASTASSTTTASTTTLSTTATTIAARLAASPTTPYRPSARSIIRSPLDIALAMQLRPGLGLGADPAWMVRFLMAMWGWLAVVVSGQGGY